MISIRKQERSIHIPWFILIVLSLSEYIIDYSPYAFANKHFIFMTVFAVCALCLFVRKKYYAPYDCVCVYILVALCLFSMVVFNFDFCYTIHWMALVFAMGIPIDFRQANYIRKFLISFGFLMALSCIFQFVAPDIFYSFGGIFLNSDWKQAASSFSTWGVFTGFSYQTGNAAYVIVISIASFMTLRKKMAILYKCTICAVLYIGIALTAKRMMFLIALTVPFMIYIASTYFNKKEISKRVIILGFSLIAFYVVLSMVLPYMSNIKVIQRFLGSDFNNGEYTSGRDLLYDQAWRYFLNQPIAGIGWSNFSKVMGTAVHNVYLQLLAETGIIGFAIFITVLTTCLTKTINAMKHACDENETVQSTLLLSFIIQGIFIINSLTGNPLYELPARTIYIFACVVGVCAKRNFEKNNIG